MKAIQKVLEGEFNENLGRNKNYYLFSASQKIFWSSETQHTALLTVKAILQKESYWSAAEIKTGAGHEE